MKGAFSLNNERVKNNIHELITEVYQGTLQNYCIYTFLGNFNFNSFKLNVTIFY